MNTITEGTNALPYLISAYVLGFLCVYGYAAWLSLSRLRLNRYLGATKKES
jgi:hypothetical protein